MTWRSRWAGLAAISVLVGVPACAPASQSGPPLPGPPQIVEVVMREYRFDYRPPASPGRALFRARNSGRVEHQLRLVPLSEDVPPISEQLRSEARRIVAPFAGMPPQRPNQSAALAVDLRPGQRYALICYVVDGDGESHARKGMSSEFRVPFVPSSADGNGDRSSRKSP